MHVQCSFSGKIHVEKSEEDGRKDEKDAEEKNGAEWHRDDPGRRPGQAEEDRQAGKGPREVEDNGRRGLLENRGADEDGEEKEEDERSGKELEESPIPSIAGRVRTKKRYLTAVQTRAKTREERLPGRRWGG